MNNKVIPYIPHKKNGKLAIDVCPDIIKWWNYEKNGQEDIKKVFAGSNKKFYFKCPVCEKEMYREMYRFLIKQQDGSYAVVKCQNCNPTKSKLRVGLEEIVPDIDKYWDYERNDGKKPSDYSKAASDKVWTFCPICGASIQRNVRHTWELDEFGIGHVIHCRSCGKQNKNNNLVNLFPDIKKFWVYEKNEFSPEYYTISSGKKAYTLCPDCGNERFIAIADTVVYELNGNYRITSCFECVKKKNLLIRRQRKTNISKCCPDISKYWDDKNLMGPEQLTVCSLEKIYTHCPSCDALLHRRAVNSFVSRDGVYHLIECIKCANAKAGTKRGLANCGSVIDECPELNEWWDYDKNILEPNKISKGSHYEAYFCCPACSKEFRRDIHSFVLRRRDGRILPAACPCCGYSSEGNPEDNLVKLCPDIIIWWNYEKNAPYIPEQFTKGSQFKAYLECPDCGLELYTGIHSLLHTNEEGKIVISHNGRCRKIRAQASENNILKKYPQAEKWWDYEKNAPNLPEDFTVYSPTFAHFKCPDCGAETYRRINEAFDVRYGGGEPLLFKCPYCAGKKVLPGFNSLEVTHPELVNNEWAKMENLLIGVNPNKILDKYPGKAWWNCNKCGKQYMMSVHDRCIKEKRGHVACIFCQGRRSKKVYFV